jgi:hypothetical protein
VRATRFLWLAAGSPLPTETDGALIQPRDMAAEAALRRRRITAQIGAARAEDVAGLELDLAASSDTPPCAACDAPATNRLGDAISDNFSTVRNDSRAWPFGGTSICQACLWCCKTLALRCGLFFARLPDASAGGGVWFVPMRPLPGWKAELCPTADGRRLTTRPDPLEAILNPPPAPFVAGLPLYGIDHGGEANSQRAIWPWTGGGAPAAGMVHAGLYIPRDPLSRLQSKHTALYAQISHSAARYRLQVDDAGDITVDVALWRELRPVAARVLALLRVGGVGATDARAALTTLSPPAGTPLAVSAPRAWRALINPLRRHVGEPWWPIFSNLLPMPDLVPNPERRLR